MTDALDVRAAVGQDVAGRGLRTRQPEQEVPAVDLLGPLVNRLGS